MTRPVEILSITMVKNEQDVIEPFVRHNLRFVDFMVVIDNNSTDETRDILEKLARETGRVAVYDRFEANFTQGAFLTRAMHAVQSIFFADYIVMLDGDEFIGAESPQHFRDSLVAIPEYGFGLLPWITYVLPEGQSFDAMTADPPQSMKWIRRDEGEQFYKVVLRPAGRILGGYVISNGNHTVTHSKGRALPSVKLPSVPLLHFPVRSLAQLTAKSVNGWMAMLAKRASGIKLEPNECHQWRENFERATKGTLQQELATASYFYSRKSGPVNWDDDVFVREHGISYERQYSDGQFADALRLVGKAWEATYLDTPSGIPESLRNSFVEWADGKASATEAANPPARNIDVPFLRWIYDYCRPARALELGCASGANLLALRYFGVPVVTGADQYDHDAVLLKPGNYYQGGIEDFQGVKTKYDMVLCLGALASLPRDQMLEKAKAIARSADRHIVFLANSVAKQGATIREDGLSMRQWLSVWRQLGWQPDLMATLAARAASTLVALRRSVLILRRADECVPEAADGFLIWQDGLNIDASDDDTPIIDAPFGVMTVHYSLGFRRKAS